jgi:UDP-glucose-4-epimerase GalE
MASYQDKPMRVLLTGGAGYVGSACFRSLRRSGIEAFVLDDLSEGNPGAVDRRRLDVADIRDTEAVARILHDRGIDSVLHFAARTSVPESIADPAGYWSTNVDGTRSLLDAMLSVGVKRIVCSSTAAVYAHDLARPIAETDPLQPGTPYGTSKLAIEYLLQGYATAYGLSAVALRYFNACGADADGQHGEAHRHETHVIPLLLQAALGRRSGFRVFGLGWPTPDGSCIRDYVSVQDLATAHLAALHGDVPGRFACYNLGSGTGTSVLDLMAAAEAATGRAIPCTVEDPRPGDPAVLVADIGKAQRVLGWSPQHSRIEQILATAWAWHRGTAGYSPAPRRAAGDAAAAEVA